jgi:uncharacterized protein YutE (UPF0331/DUF86 family)
MTDAALVSKKLALIESCVSDLERLARPEAIETDVRELRFVEHTLQLAIQAALDVASHIVSDRRLGEPRTNRELFDLLHRDGWIDAGLTATLRSLAGFRNVLVHGYDDVNLAIVRNVLDEHLGDLGAFVDAIRRRMRTPGCTGLLVRSARAEARGGRGWSAVGPQARLGSHFTEYFVKAPPACVSEFGPSAAYTLPSASTATPSPAVP